MILLDIPTAWMHLTDREEVTECTNSINNQRIYDNEDYFYVRGSCCSNDLSYPTAQPTDPEGCLKAFKSTSNVLKV